MNTVVLRIPLVDPSGIDLPDRIKNLCVIQAATGLHLAAATAVGDQFILIFQDKVT